MKGPWHRLYYKLWQRDVAKIYTKLNEKYNFDIAHNLTYVTVNQPCYLYKSARNFIWGPVGGGETIPFNLLDKIGIKNAFIEFIRSIIVKTRKFNSNFRRCARYAQKILVVNQDTKNLFSESSSKKIEMFPAIGVDSIGCEQIDNNTNSNNNCIKLLIVGVLYYRKGIDIALEVVKKLVERNVAVTLTVVGDGKSKNEYLSLVKKYKIDNNVKFMGNIAHDKVEELMKESDLFIFPSRRDSGGFVIIEAIKNNLPVICLDKGGPAEVLKINNNYGWIIDSSKRRSVVINNIANIIAENIECIKAMKNKINKLQLKDKYEWKNKAKRIVEIYDEIINL